MKLKIFEYFYTETDAMEEAVNNFGDLYSIQETTTLLRNENIVMIFVWYTEKPSAVWDKYREEAE